MFSNKNFYIFFIIIILIISSQSKKQIMLLDGDALDSQINLSSKSNTKLFLIFYVEHCIYCSHALKILKEKIVKNFEDEDEISFGVINLDDQKNVWTGLRFNISRIPYVILIEKEKMYYYQNAFEENLVMKFINEEKNEEDALDIPPPSNFFDKLKAVNKELAEKLGLFFEKFGLKKEFANKITYAVIILGFIIFVYIESKIIALCSNLCRKNKQIVKENNKNNSNKKIEKKKNE